MAYTNYIDDMEIKDPNDPNTYITYGIHDKDHRDDTVAHVTASDKTNWSAHASENTYGNIKAWLSGTTLYIKTTD